MCGADLRREENGYGRKKAAGIYDRRLHCGAVGFFAFPLGGISFLSAGQQPRGYLELQPDDGAADGGVPDAAHLFRGRQNAGDQLCARTGLRHNGRSAAGGGSVRGIDAFHRDAKPRHQALLLAIGREPRKELFNTGNILASISAGGLPLLLAGMPDNLASLPALGLSLLFAALCILVNLTLFILYYQVGGMGQFGTLMRQNIGGLLPNIIATVPLGLLLGIVINMPNSYFYIVLFMAPLMLARYSFKLYLDSKSMHMRTIAALSMAVDAKDHYTQGHSRRVAYYSEAIARAMHKSPSFVADVKTAALLHDVGKIGIDDAVLNKPAALTAEEFELIQQHPVMGRKIIDSICFSDTVNDAVLYHHHRYDAKGYPAEGPRSRRAAALCGYPCRCRYF